jgi:3-oxoacyl-[acyl-carrier protein] reductase
MHGILAARADSRQAAIEAPRKRLKTGAFSMQTHAAMSEQQKKTALVVGGSRGIGRAIAVRLARSGFDIWLTYQRNHEAAEEARAEIQGLGRECDCLAFDIADAEATQAALGEKADASPPHAVVFNAGITRDNLMVWMTKEEWDTVLSTNLDGFYNVIHAVLFPMLREKRGRIVIVSSTSGQVGRAGQVNYSASKAGLIGAMKALAREVGKKGLLVNVVAPGVIETDMTSELPIDRILPMIPLNRLGHPDDVASVVDFLCAEERMYIHGQVIGINGGLAM